MDDDSARVHYFAGDASGAKASGPQWLDPDSSLRLVVVHTTLSGTAAALLAAAKLAKSFGTVVKVVVAQSVSFHLPLERPPISIDFLRRRLCQVSCEAGLRATDVRIEICLCRDQVQALREMLAPHSLIFMAGRGRWRSRRESKLAEILSDAGHYVIVIDTRLQKSSLEASLGARGIGQSRDLRLPTR